MIKSKQVHIDKYNRQKAEGSPFLNPIGIISKWALIFTAYNATNRSTRDTLIVMLILLWLKGDFDWLKNKKLRPKFIYLTRANASTGLPAENTYFIKTIFLGDKPWIEFTHHCKVRGDESHIWLLVPESYNDIVWRFIQERKNNETLFTPQDFDQLEHLLNNHTQYESPIKCHSIVRLDVWKNYFKHCALRDERLANISKAVLTSEESISKTSAPYYLSKEGQNIRNDIFVFMNRAIKRLTTSVQNFELQHLFKLCTSDDKAKSTFLWKTNTNMAKYISKTTNHIQNLEYSKSSGYIETKPEYFGAKNIPALDFCQKFLRERQIAVTNLTPPNLATKEDRITHHNELTLAFATHFITLHGARPTHSIGPTMDAFDNNKVILKDKGCARELMLSNFAKEQFTYYVEHRAQIGQIFPELNHSQHLLMLFDEDKKIIPLNAKRLVSYVKKHTNDPNFVPYLFRRAFSQLLDDIGCPTSILPSLMGHANSGEQAGAATKLQKSTGLQLEYLNRIATLLDVRSLF